MPIKLHLTLALIFQFGGAAGSIFLVISQAQYVEALGVNRNLATVAALILGAVIPRLIFKFLIPAKCPECAGRSMFHGGRPITYHCRACGYVYETSISDGGRMPR